MHKHSNQKRMTSKTFAPGYLLLVFIAGLFVIGLLSFNEKQTYGRYQLPLNDTTPKKPARPGDGKTDNREKKIRDLDAVLEELDNADMKVNMENIHKEISEAMKKFDGDKIKLKIEKAMKDVDMAKIQKDVQESLAKVDFEKITEDVANAMKEVDIVKIQQEVQESLAKVDFDKMKIEMEKVKDIDFKKLEVDMKKLQEEMKDLQPKLEIELTKAKADIEKAKAELKEYKTFVDGLDAAGLINKKESYTLKHKDGELLINGKKASPETYSKYRPFLEKHKKFTIEKSDDDFDMDID